MSSSDYVELDKSCPECNQNKWCVADKIKWYQEICGNCGYMNEITKQDFIDNFQCPDCNCLECTLEENKNLLATRCKNCNRQTIVLEKHTTTDHRSSQLEKQNNPTPTTGTPKCPTCQSADIKRISVTAKVTNATLFGLFGNRRKKTFHCNSCKYEW